jgi:hemin uptake protein HemP
MQSASMRSSINSATAPAQPATPAQVGAQAPALCTRTLSSDELLRGDRSVDISHNGSVYRLHATRLGKLILTK